MSTPYADTDNTQTARHRAPLTAVLRSRAYMLLWTAQFAAMVAGFFNYVAVAWLTLQLTGSNLAVGSVLAAAAVPQALFMLLGGAVSDRFTPRSTMVAAGVSRGAVMAIVAALTLTHSIEMWELFVAAVLVGATSAFWYPASTSMVPRLLAPDQFEAGNALLNLSRTAAIVLGPAAAGAVVAAVGAGSALAVDAAASAAASLLVLPLPAGERISGKPRTNPVGDVRDGLLQAWRDVPIRAALLVIAVLNFFALGAVEVGLPALAYHRFSQGAVALGTTFAAWGLGSTFGSIAAATRPAPRRFGWGMVVLVALIGAGVAAAGVAPSLPVVLGVMVVLGAVEGAGTTYLMSWMQRRTDPAMQGRVMSLVIFSSVGVEPVALAIAGSLASRSLALLFWASAAAIGLTAIAAALSPSVRNMTSSSEPGAKREKPAAA
ncbi:MAG TPA: MFS transporter [Candidatus Dormibacteraeota bacterium]|nr:MFS transporter [Candidatus Dormibacteraeota bacterium]